MKIDDGQLREFISLWEEQFAEKLSLDEASHEASRLLELYALLYLPTADEAAPEGSTTSPSNP